MTSQGADGSVLMIGAELVAEAVEALASAFEDYPLTRHFFRNAGRDYRACLRAMFRLSCEYRLTLGWPLFGVAEGGRVVGAACVSVPDARPEPPEMKQTQQAFLKEIGPAATRRIQEYSRQKAAHLPEAPHCYLAAIGVRPDCQGRGHGSALLQRVHTISRAHPGSTGVALDTQSVRNIALYEHLGYRLTAEAHVGQVPMYCMFRPDR